MNEFKWEAFDQVPIVGIVRNLPTEHLITIGELYARAGMTTIEITLNTPGALDAIIDLRKHLGDKLNIGAGTVCSLADLDLAVNAGAAFIVTPVVNDAVIRKCVDNNITIFPGAYTPSEIYHAWSLGAKMIKVFPATRLGPEYIRDILAPLNAVKLLPTGGISAENFEAFMKAGASGVGMGSNLFPAGTIQDNDWNTLETNFRAYVSLANNSKALQNRH